MSDLDKFLSAFEYVIGHEGGFGDIRSDPGNWTGGAVGSGTLAGTKYGISAAAYPTLDIRNITLDQARTIYRRDYWDKAGCQHWDRPLAVIMFDAAVNNGVSRANKWLQGAAGATADGIVGPLTVAAVQKKDQAELAHEVHAQRIYFMAGLSTWSTFGLGWSRRLARVPAQAHGTGSGGSYG